jgi:hypothetical protein
MSQSDDFWDDPFDDSNYFTGPPLTEAMIQAAETTVGYKLPQSYLRLIRIKNGGSLKRDCFPTDVPTSWAKDHVALSGILGIGGEWGIDSKTLGSRKMIPEWGYPDVGIVVGECPSAGHDVIMLDYSKCGHEGEPRVVHVETETSDAPEVLVLALDFETFLRGLVESSRYEQEDESED